MPPSVSTYVDQREEKLKMLAGRVHDLEKSKNGHLRSVAELNGIQRARVAKRQEVKKERLQVFSQKEKTRDLEVSRNRDLKYHISVPPLSAKAAPTSTAKWKQNRAVKAEKQVELPVQSYTKAQKSAFREMKQREKLAKRARKKERQASRETPVTESFHNGAWQYTQGDKKIMAILKDTFDYRQQWTFLDPLADMLRQHRVVIQSVLYVQQMAAAPDLGYCVSLTFGFITSMSDRDCQILDRLIIIGWVTMFYESLRKSREASARESSNGAGERPEVVTESLSEILTGASSSISQVLESDAVESIRSLITVSVAWNWFGKDFSSRASSFLGKVEKRRYTIPETVAVILSSLSSLARMGELLTGGYPLSRVFMSENPLRTALRDSEHYLKIQDMVYFGLPTSGLMCAKQFVSESSEVYEALSALSGKLNPYSNDGRKVAVQMLALGKARLTVQSQLERSIRATPIGIIVHGPPGIGKSSVTSLLCQLHSKIKGRVFEQSHMFERVASSQYWDGYDGYSTPYIHYSEVGTTAAHIVKTRGDDTVRELTSVIDSLPFVCDMSDVKDKGKVQCLAEMVLIDTNSPELNLPQMVNNPAAYRRRFIYLQPVVKPEFCKPGSSELDSSKGTSDEYHNKWNFSISTFDALDRVNSIEVSHLSASDPDSDFAGFERVMTKLMTDHIVREEYNRAQKSRNVFVEREEAEKRLQVSHLEAVSESLTSSFHGVRDFVDLTSLWVFFSFLLSSFFSIGLDLGHVCWYTVEYALLLLGHMRKGFAGFWIFVLLCGLHYLGVLWLAAVFVISVVCQLDLHKLSRNQISERISAVRRDFFERFDHIWMRSQRLFSYLTLEDATKNTFCTVELVSFLTFASAGCVLVWQLLKYFTEKSENPHSESSSFNVDSAASTELKSLEDHFHCGRAYKRVPVKGTKIWNNVSIQPSLHLSGFKSLSQFVQRNQRRCVVRGKTKVETYCLGVYGSYALIHLHSFGDFEDTVTISVCAKGGIEPSDHYYHTIVRKSDYHLVTTDIVLVCLNGVSFRNIVKHFPIEDVSFRNACGRVGSDDVMVNKIDGPLRVVDPVMGSLDYDSVVEYSWHNHKRGVCGLPVVADRDSGSCIVGIHSAGVADNNLAYAIVLTRDQIMSAAKVLEAKPVAPVFSESLVTQGILPHPKSPVRYEDLGSIEYFGQISTPCMHNKSKLRQSCLALLLPDFFFKEFQHERDTIYVPPLMQPMGSGDAFRSPYNIGLRKMSRTKKPLVPARVESAVNIVCEQLLSNLKGKGIPRLSPLCVDDALNGNADDAFIRRIDMMKAAGFGTPGKKNAYAIRVVREDGSTYDEPTDQLKRQVGEIIVSYMKGNNCGPVYTAQLKDEPRDEEKVLMGKTRLFFATPFAYLIVQRMFLAPFYTLMVQFSEEFYTAIGVDMHREAHVLFESLKNFSPLILEGDYGGYDQSMPFEIGRGANTIVLRILQHFGYDDHQLQIAAGLLSDALFPVVSMIGEIMRIPGLQPSGKYATAEDNSLRNLLIVVYIWLSTPEVSRKDVFEHLLPKSYGDDVLIAVKPEVSDDFDAIVFAEVCERETDLTFTTSSKGVVDKAFETLDSMSFLKRTFVFHEGLGRVVAPLALDSIYKTLEWFLPSSSVNEVTQMEMICESSLREIFFHGDQEKFNRCRDWLLAGLKEAFPDASFVLSTYEKVYESLTLPTETTPVLGGRQEGDEMLPVSESRILADDDRHLALGAKNGGISTTDTISAGFDRPVEDYQWSAQKHVIISQHLDQLREEIVEVSETFKGLSDPFPGMEVRQVKQSLIYASNPGLKRRCDRFYAMQSHLAALKLTYERLWRWMQRYRSQQLIHTESSVINDMNTGSVPSSDVDVHENVTDIGGTAKDSTSAGSPNELQTGQHNTLDLSEFLSRPLSLTSFSVTTGSDLDYSVDLWSAFLLQPSVRAKIRNYAFLRGTMNVRIAVAGTPFHYGKLQVSYQPLAGVNANIPIVDGNLAVPALRIAGLSYLSQAPGRTVIDVKDNQPLEIQCPFLSPQPMLRLFNKNPLILPDAIEFDDSVGFGKLYINSLEPIKSASDTPTNISVNIYMWMTDVELGTPTGTVIEIGTESRVVDEREVGPVERVATRASEVAHALTSVPMIAPFAKASGMALDGIGSLAALFGFSVPTMNTEPSHVKDSPYQNGANVIGYDTGKRITLDPKQELSVDPRVLGISSDDMSIAHLCSVESLLDVFDWDDAEIPLSAPLWVAPINPRIKKKLAFGLDTLYQPTALSFAATPFEYWRGDITFRFEIVCSSYHRGKLAFYFEPNISQNVVIDTVLDLNKQFVKIVDIQETQDVSFTVKWAFPKAWARNISDALIGDLGTVGFLGLDLFDYANGYIAVTPFTALQSPNGSDIKINVYVASDNMMFNQLSDTNMPTQRPTVESRIISECSDVEHMNLNESSASTAHICEEHFGEVPVSFRGLGKRFTAFLPADGLPYVSNGDKFAVYGGVPIYPPPSPAFNGTATTAVPNVYCYLRYAYVGMRGGTKHRVSYTGNLEMTRTGRVVVRLKNPSTTQPVLGVGWNFQSSNSPSNIATHMTGAVAFIPHTNGGVEFETPLYTNNLFGFAFSDDPFPSTSTLVNASLTRTFDVVCALDAISAAPTGRYAMHDFALAEDFSFMRFQGAPAYVVS